MTTHTDLRAIITESDWYATITIPAPSQHEDARARFELEWRNLRRRLSDRWDDDEVARLEEQIGGLEHFEGASFVVVHAKGGSTLIEALAEPISAGRVDEGPLPRLATIVEARQRALAHVVVEADRAGADLTAFDGGEVLATRSVEGSTEHIHRGHPGGWSQRRFQQRAENRWEDNARGVADAVATLAREVGAELVAVAGDVRAQTFVLDHLPTEVATVAVKIEAGSPEGIADEVVRLLSTKVAARVTAAAERLRTGVANGLATVDSDVVVDALEQGRVETLLVHDDADGDTGDPRWRDLARRVDESIATALATDAEVLVVPNLAVMDGPLAATMRW